MFEVALVDAVFHGEVATAEIRDWLSHVETLLLRRQDFLFMASTAEGATFSKDYRAVQAQWYRQHKAAFHQHCRGLVRIAHSAQEQARLDTPALHAAWGVPYAVVTDRAGAYEWLVQRMECLHDQT
ncbi:hypothetical protein [Lampropedia puyangensis]|nr:hypothetical protein [Lampropedia puyangensis]